MSDWHDGFRNRRDVVTIPVLWLAIALSLLVHLAAMWEWLPRMRVPSLDARERGRASGSLEVQLAARPSHPPAPAPPPSPPPAAARRAVPAPTPPARPPQSAARSLPTPPMIALNAPPPGIGSPPPSAPAVAPPSPASPPAYGDLSSYLEARRRARSESEGSAVPDSESNAPPVEDDNARRNRIIAGNLAPQTAPTFGHDPKNGGGVFRIVRLGFDDAEFMFFGWNREIRRTAAQRIEVRKGGSGDIRIAVVRRIIAIIREHEQEDFLWESRRLGRNLLLSARAADNAELEEFMMREFFGGATR